MELWRIRLKQFRLAKGWSQKDLAKRAGVNQSHICHLETENRSYTEKTLKTIIKELGITEAHLFLSQETFFHPDLDLLKTQLATIEKILDQDFPPEAKERRKSYSRIKKILRK